MNSSLTYLKNHFVCFGAAVVLLLLSVCSSNAQIVLTVNISNPNDVVITATGGLATSTASGNFFDGIDLVGLFNSSVGFTEIAVNSTNLSLGNGSSTQTFTEASGDDASGTEGGEFDLNLFHNHVPDQVSFTENEDAFTGSITLNLTQSSDGDSTGIIASEISHAGGNVVVFDGGAVVGSYQVIEAPEPQSWALLVAGVALLGLLRFRVAGRLTVRP